VDKRARRTDKSDRDRVVLCSGGPSHALARTDQGAQTYFELINDEGGVAGRKLSWCHSMTATIPAKTETCSAVQAEWFFALGFFVYADCREIFADGRKRPRSSGRLFTERKRVHAAAAWVIMCGPLM